jgi:hypothetical protein
VGTEFKLTISQTRLLLKALDGRLTSEEKADLRCLKVYMLGFVERRDPVQPLGRGSRLMHTYRKIYGH